MILLIVPLQEAGVFRRHMIADTDMQAVGVITVVEVFQHHLPVPRQVFVGVADFCVTVIQVEVRQQFRELLQRRRERIALFRKTAKNKPVPDLRRQ